MRIIATVIVATLVSGLLQGAEGKGKRNARRPGRSAKTASGTGVTVPSPTFEKMPASLAELDVPLVVQEVAGVNRRQDVCSSGIPMPHGLLREPEGVCLISPDGNPVPAQFRVLERWRDKGVGKGDESIKWLLVTFLADAPAGKAVVYRLKAGQNPAPPKPVTLEKKGQSYVLNGLELKSDFSAPFRAVLTTPEGQEISAGELPLTWTVWEDGPVRSCVKAESATVKGKFGLIAYAYSYAGQKRWDLSITLKNTPNKTQGPLYIRDFSVSWAPPELTGAGDYCLGGEWGKHYSGKLAAGSTACLYQASDGTDSWATMSKRGKKWENAFVKGKLAQAGAPSFRGYRVTVGGKETGAGNFAQGQAALCGEKGGAFACVRDFLHQYPKATEVDSGKITLRLWPKYYKGYGGVQWLDDCTRKTHEISFVLTGSRISGADAESRARAFDAPLLAFPGVDWIRKTGVRGYISKRFKDTGSKVPTGLTSRGCNWLTFGAPNDRSRRRYSGMGADGYLKNGDVRRAYGLRRIMLSSTGITPFWVDEYTYPEGKGRIDCPTGYMRPPRATGKYRSGTSHHKYNAWNDQHFCAVELADGWRIFGEPMALDAVRRVGVWGQFYVDYRKTHKTNNPRRDSMPWENLCEAYRVTGDPGMLAAIREWESIAWEQQIDKLRGYYAAKKVGGDFYVFQKAGLRSVKGKKQVVITESWPLSSVCDALSYSYKITGNENVPDMILGITDFIFAEGFAGWPGGVAYKIPLDPAIQKEMNEKYATGAGWSLRESLPTLARAYLYTGEKRYLDLFMEPVRHLKKSAAFTKMVKGSGWRTTGCHFDWSNEADRALEERRIDSTPPGAVTDLRAEALGGGRVRLIWSKPGGDPVGYKVKWTDKPMIDRIDWQTQAKTHTNWWAAENVAGEPRPNGAKGNMVVEDVPAGRRVFAIRSRDAVGNRSVISNMATVEVK